MDNARLEELFDSLGPISIRKLFGGKGIYCDGVIVAVVVRGELMLKADEESIPDDAFDDRDEMAVWARRAYEAGRRAGK
ncbi:MAG: TfoX/Sxy family protein [Alphaproteobacteria bacterium]|nr:TfoX/Sxy family protein [Alphaproteobacteria bacterium]